MDVFQHLSSVHVHYLICKSEEPPLNLRDPTSGAKIAFQTPSIMPGQPSIIFYCHAPHHVA